MLFFIMCVLLRGLVSVFFFFFNDTATTEIYTLSLHDALPIFHADLDQVSDPGQVRSHSAGWLDRALSDCRPVPQVDRRRDRKSTRLNSSHSQISYAVFCLKKKKIKYLLSSNYLHIC